MRAVVARNGRPEVLERPDPEPGVGEVLVCVEAAGIIDADLSQISGRHPPPPGAPPEIPGLELAGEIVALGAGVRDYAVGDHVMALVGGGAHAELAVVPEPLLVRTPPQLTSAEAGGFVEVFATAHDALFTQAELRSGERLLVHAAAGAVGLAAIQLGLAAGASVTATVRNERVRERVSALGARVLDPAFFGEAAPFDVVFELVGAPNLAADVRSLATGGRIVVIGVLGGSVVEFDLLELMRRRGRISGSTMRARPLEEKALVVRRLEREVVPHLASGRIKVVLDETFPLSRVAEAYRHLEQGGRMGKVVLLNQE